MANKPISKQLTSYKIIPYYWQGRINPSLSDEDYKLCDNAIKLIYEECKGDRLEKNYTKDHLHLDEMLLYNILFDKSKPVMATGTQKINDNVMRVFSRYWHFKNYRTDGTKLFDKVDNFEELQYTLNLLKYKCVIWSRDKSKGFFVKLKAARPDIFNDWKIYPTKLNILYPNNNQYIFYKGDINLL